MSAPVAAPAPSPEASVPTAAGPASAPAPAPIALTAPIADRSAAAPRPGGVGGPDVGAADRSGPAPRAAARRRAAASVPAGLGRRLAARLVDTVVLAVVATAAAVPLGNSVLAHVQQKLDQARMASSLTRRQVDVWLVDGVVVGKVAVLLGILAFVGLLYEVLPTARTGQTFGKRLARIKVVAAGPAATRGRLPFGRSLLRWLVRNVSAVLLLGLVWPVFDRPARRGWHDRAAGTRVVRG
ncbi:RDD family protein [Kitasatospora sp. CM 4170]|uniref:RDD family protein n=1 Tax=Kitasatospora aburaviensis TaxID=67265 RepID=A0ABW1EVZ1_9ACTN|nr:RDD family protein [Kitasatospora sp. CM 4170]WNM45994.1 RDD family protein [Kitasatospora sp. CM 4170]